MCGRYVIKLLSQIDQVLGIQRGSWKITDNFRVMPTDQVPVLRRLPCEGTAVPIQAASSERLSRAPVARVLRTRASRIDQGVMMSRMSMAKVTMRRAGGVRIAQDESKLTIDPRQHEARRNE
jgi:hypothetical protein